MSTYWGYRCVTCDVASPTWWNHGDDRLRALWQARAALVPAMRVIADTSLWIEVSTMGTYDPPFPLDFLLAHDGHTLVLQDEYDRQQPLEEPS